MKKKVLLDLDERIVDRLDSLRDDLGVTSRSVVVSMLIEATKQFTPTKAQLVLSEVSQTNLIAANIAP